MNAATFKTSEIEAGRKLFAADWQFAFAAGTAERLPPMQGIEIAFAGRSNVGKSTLINALTGRKALARTSHTPGRTQELIYFTAPPPSPLRLVDMPGYGYAEAPKSTVQAWTALIHAYLSGRSNLARVYVLIDARHGLKTADDAVLKTLDVAAVSYQIVLTKGDQVPAKELEARLADTAAAIKKRAAAFPEILVTSSREGTGMPELRATIARMVTERS
jgi:GTP-binding protein